MTTRDYDPTRHTPQPLPTVIGGEVQDSALSLQERADELFRFHGTRADSPMMGETDVQYTRRILHAAKRYSPEWAGKDLSKLHNTMLPVAFAQIVDGGVAELKKPVGPLREQVVFDDSGRKIRRFYGDPAYCWDQFKPATRQIVTGFGKTATGKNAPGAVVPRQMLMSDGSVRAA